MRAALLRAARPLLAARPRPPAAMAEAQARRAAALVARAAPPEGPPEDDELASTPDLYGGVKVHADELPACAEAFAARLAASLAAWKRRGVRGVWLQLPAEKAAFVPVAVSEGFDYHHAEPTHVMLTKWISDGEPSTLPPNASHQVGVGAFVVNAKGEVLLVQERRGPAARPDFWKVPTGLVEQGEDIADAAMREVREETGVEVEFHSLVALRQAHGAAFGKSDLFFMCACSPVGSEAITIQQSEIKDARWMDVDEWLNTTQYPKASLWAVVNSLGREYFRGRYTGFAAASLEVGLRPGANLLFWNTSCEDAAATAEAVAAQTAERRREREAEAAAKL